MSVAHTTATTHAPVRGAHASDEEAPVKGSLWANVRRSWRVTESALAYSALNPIIGWLLRLRKRAGADSSEAGEFDNDGPGESRHAEGRPGSRSERHNRPDHAEHHSGGAHAAEDSDAKLADDEAPGDRRLFKLLVFLCVLVGGGMAGSAVSFYLLESLVSRNGATIEKQSNVISTLEKKLGEAQAKLAEADKKLAASGIVATEKKLLEAQVKRLELEKKLEEAAMAGTERQKRLDEAAKTLGSILAAERASKNQKPGNRASSAGSDNVGSPGAVSSTVPPGATIPASSPGAASSGSVPTTASLSGKTGSGSKTSASKSAECTLTAGKVSSGLKDCVADYKR